MHKYFKHYRIFKEKKANGYVTFRHDLVGDSWGYIVQNTESVQNGADIQDGYIEEYSIQLNNYHVNVNDILKNGEDEYKITSSTMVKNKCYARAVKEWYVQ